MWIAVVDGKQARTRFYFEPYELSPKLALEGNALVRFVRSITYLELGRYVTRLNRDLFGITQRFGAERCRPVVYRRERSVQAKWIDPTVGIPYMEVDAVWRAQRVIEFLIDFIGQSQSYRFSRLEKPLLHNLLCAKDAPYGLANTQKLACAADKDDLNSIRFCNPPQFLNLFVKATFSRPFPIRRQVISSPEQPGEGIDHLSQQRLSKLSQCVAIKDRTPRRSA